MLAEVKKQLDRFKKQTKIKLAYQDLFGTPTGQMVLHDMMREHDLLSVAKTLDHASLAYAQGEQAVIKRILVYLNTDFTNVDERMKQYVKAMEE